MDSIFASKLIKISSKIFQKVVSNLKLVSESVFFRFLVDFGSILDQFWLQNGRRFRNEIVFGSVPDFGSKIGSKNCKNASLGSIQGLQKRIWRLRNFQDRFLDDFWTSNDQKCDLASTKCTSMSVLNVENQSFCNAFSNFPTFFQSKRTSRCPKLVPNDYFCSRGDSFFMVLGEVSLSCRNLWNVKKTKEFFNKIGKKSSKMIKKRGLAFNACYTFWGYPQKCKSWQTA